LSGDAAVGRGCDGVTIQCGGGGVFRLLLLLLISASGVVVCAVAVDHDAVHMRRRTVK